MEEWIGAGPGDLTTVSLWCRFSEACAQARIRYLADVAFFQFFRIFSQKLSTTGTAYEQIAISCHSCHIAFALMFQLVRGEVMTWWGVMEITVDKRPRFSWHSSPPCYRLLGAEEHNVLGSSKKIRPIVDSGIIDIDRSRAIYAERFYIYERSHDRDYIVFYELQIPINKTMRFELWIAYESMGFIDLLLVKAHFFCAEPGRRVGGAGWRWAG